MTTNYAQFVEQKCKKPDDITLTPEAMHLIHMVLGVSGEAGELLDNVKKHAVYGFPIDLKNLVEELGDIEFYLQGIRNAIGITREEILQRNMDKLDKRYSTGVYSDDQAIKREDKQNA